MKLHFAQIEACGVGEATFDIDKDLVIELVSNGQMLPTIAAIEVTRK
ncbi:MAG: hypothetical protein HYV60_02710 [Planctomycetia bacterium]|nr:hypothetical protein [Planctomycetia bacterium]